MNAERRDGCPCCSLLLQWSSLGFLVGWESLLSTYGKELFMLGDLYGALQALEAAEAEHAPLVGVRGDPEADKLEFMDMRARVHGDGLRAHPQQLFGRGSADVVGVGVI